MIRPQHNQRPQFKSPYVSGYKHGSDFDRPLFSRIPLLMRIVVGLVFVGALTMMGFIFFGAAAVEGSSTGCTVTDKDRTSDGEGGSDMRIYTTGCDDSSAVKVFKVADNLFVQQYASANTYSSIQVGKTYDFETRGYRIPILSQFENIIGFTETK